jgi:hypothetical protein
MRTEMALETSVTFNQLTRLMAREAFIHISSSRLLHKNINIKTSEVYLFGTVMILGFALYAARR